MKLRREKLPSQDTDTPHKPPSVSSPIADSKPDIAALAAISVSPHRPRKRKRIPYTLVEASKGNRCPTSGCDGVGHITGLYAMHFAVSGCPLAHGKTPEECKARREELNRLRNKNFASSGEWRRRRRRSGRKPELKASQNDFQHHWWVYAAILKKDNSCKSMYIVGGGGRRKKEGGRGVGGGRKGERGRRREMGMGKEKFEGGGGGGGKEEGEEV